MLYSHPRWALFRRDLFGHVCDGKNLFEPLSDGEAVSACVPAAGCVGTWGGIHTGRPYFVTRFLCN